MLRVNGGPANSGCKRGLKEPAKNWVCTNGHRNHGYATRCLTAGCNEERPK